MGKKALAVLRKDVANILREAIDGEVLLKEVFSQGDGDGVELYPSVCSSWLFYLDSVLLDRDICETDTEYLQLLPYITFVSDSADGKYNILTYQRGKGGDESRLHSKYSVGIGGHVESYVTEETTLLDVLVETALREMEEEIGVSLDQIEAGSSIEEMSDTFRDDFFEQTRMIYCNNDEGSVHLGLSIVLFIPAEMLSKMVGENNVITNLQLVPATKEAFSAFNLEPWSAAVLDNLIPALETVVATNKQAEGGVYEELKIVTTES